MGGGGDCTAQQGVQPGTCVRVCVCVSMHVCECVLRISAIHPRVCTCMPAAVLYICASQPVLYCLSTRHPFYASHAYVCVAVVVMLCVSQDVYTVKFSPIAHMSMRLCLCRFNVCVCFCVCVCVCFSQDVYTVKFSPYFAGNILTSGTGHIRFWKMASTFTGTQNTHTHTHIHSSSHHGGVRKSD